MHNGKVYILLCTVQSHKPTLNITVQDVVMYVYCKPQNATEYKPRQQCVLHIIHSPTMQQCIFLYNTVYCTTPPCNSAHNYTYYTVYTHTMQ